jgi:hypothetical protein
VKETVACSEKIAHTWKPEVGEGGSGTSGLIGKAGSPLWLGLHTVLIIVLLGQPRAARRNVTSPSQPTHHQHCGVSERATTARFRELTMSVAMEEKHIRSLIDRVEVIEDVAHTMDEGDQRRARLLSTAHDELVEVGTVRPLIAARLLGLSERTVRAWAEEGVLTVVRHRPLRLDLLRVHEVMHLVQELRDAGRNRDLLDAVWFRLSDQAVLDRDDLRESLEQMHRGEGRIVHPLRPE